MGFQDHFADAIRRTRDAEQIATLESKITAARRGRRRLVAGASLLSLLLGLVAGGGFGCCASIPDRARAARDLRDAWSVYRRATVPHPAYDEAGREEVERAAHELEAALWRLSVEEER